MTISVHIYPNDGMLTELPDDMENSSAGNNQRLSLEENPSFSHLRIERTGRIVIARIDAALQRLDALVKKFAKPDAQPLSDYAISREGIYEDHHGIRL